VKVLIPPLADDFAEAIASKGKYPRKENCSLITSQPCRGERYITVGGLPPGREPMTGSSFCVALSGLSGVI
jgi:hypothetical protein